MAATTGFGEANSPRIVRAKVCMNTRSSGRPSRTSAGSASPALKNFPSPVRTSALASLSRTFAMVAPRAVTISGVMLFAFVPRMRRSATSPCFARSMAGP